MAVRSGRRGGRGAEQQQDATVAGRPLVIGHPGEFPALALDRLDDFGDITDGPAEP
jgi:hypothetical protein